MNNKKQKRLLFQCIYRGNVRGKELPDSPCSEDLNTGLSSDVSAVPIQYCSVLSFGTNCENQDVSFIDHTGENSIGKTSSRLWEGKFVEDHFV